MRRFLFVFICLAAVSRISGQPVQVIDSLRAEASRLESSSDSVYVKACFGVADYFMDLDQYDSAQFWLNRVRERLPVKRPGLFSYFLTTRQAEVYYYNNLQELGLQESYRALEMARQLEDSFLIADSYNFQGLFSLNRDSLDHAIYFFQQALRYVKPPPYPAAYLSLTLPHHIYGNLAETYFKHRFYDSAIRVAHISMSWAKRVPSIRGVAVAQVALADTYLEAGRTDSAAYYYEKAIQNATQGADLDVELLAYGGLARTELIRGQGAEAGQLLEKGFDLLKSNPHLNQFFSLRYLDMAADIYRQQKDFIRLAATLSYRTELEKVQTQRSNGQLQSILAASVRNEVRLLNMEIAEARQKQKLSTIRMWVVILVAGVLLVLSYLWWYRSRQRWRLSQVRSKISQDLHDDVGATLTSISLLSEVALHQQDAGERRAVLERIGLYSRNLINDMSDIVWVINPGNDSFSRITDRMKNFAQPLLASAGMELHFSAEPDLDGISFSMQDRKNFYLIFKEALNNAVRHSGAGSVTISLDRDQQLLRLRVTDNGRGFSGTPEGSGNGLRNMQIRARESGGQLTMESIPGRGTQVVLQMPLTQNA